MNPGLARYQAEWDRFWRRLSLMVTIASLVMFLPFLLLLQSPELRRSVRNVQRFGFAGNERYVRQIQISALGAPRGGRTRSSLIDPEALETRRRGGARTRHAIDEAGTPVRKAQPFRPPGVGDSDEEILARARARAGDTPLFQSQELVIEQLVEPEYPTEARERGFEGRVSILALIDTLGFVRQAEIVGSAERVLDRAAMDAVLQCKFQPYTVEGRAREVYAMFRFAFRLLN